MRLYILDTNAMSDLVKNPAGAVAHAISDRLESEIATSLIVAAELRYGAARKASPRLRAAVEALLRLVEAAADETELDDVYETERHLLYVACTRARDRLLISAVRPGSEYIQDFGIDDGNATLSGQGNRLRLR